MAGAWGVMLGGVYLSGGTPDTNLDNPACSGITVKQAGCLTAPPKGLGPPARRTEDTTYVQRDGVKHHNDWYEPRIIELTVSVCSDDCPGCGGTEGSARQKLSDLMSVWGRSCCDVEIVIFTDCHEATAGAALAYGDEGPYGEGYYGGSKFSTAGERALNGPFGILGRPRISDPQWIGGGSKCADVLLRFDCVDQRIYVLDACGRPGIGNVANIQPGIETLVSCYDGPSGTQCYPICYDTPASGSTFETTVVNIGGTEAVYPTITLYPNLNNPKIVNYTTGDFITFSGLVLDFPVEIDTYNGTAMQNGESVTHLLGGSIYMSLLPGNYEIHLLQSGDFSDDDIGYAQFAWRDTVVTA